MSGEADSFDRLWAPHRMPYILGEGKPAEGADADCPLCAIPGQPEPQGLVVARGQTTYAILNRYPYNPGHLMVCPYRHVADYTDLTDDELTETASLTRAAVRTLRRTAGPAGFNIGLNLGPVAGAGIAEHLHQHVVPRWGGDTNFMPVVGHTRVLPQLLADTRDLLAQHWGNE